LTVGGDARAVLWEFEASGRPHPRDLLVGHQKPVNAAALMPSGRFAATAGQDNTVMVWDIAKANPSEHVKILEGHDGEITDLLFSSDSAWLFSSSTDKSIRAWNAEAGWAGTALSDHGDEVVRLAISRDDHYLVSVDVKGQLRTWDLKAPLGQPKQRLQAHEREIWSIVFSENGKHMLTGSADRNARLWTIGADGLGNRPVVLRGHADTINTGSFSHDGKWIATGSRDGTIRLWDLDSKHPEENARVLEMSESNGVEWVLFGPDNKRLYAGNGDGSIHIWHVDPLANRNDHQVLQGHEKKVSGLAMPADGRYLLSSSFDGTARVWPMIPPKMIALACYTAGRSPTEAEWKQWVINPEYEYKPICG
jgi:WD40 repeat protein